MTTSAFISVTLTTILAIGMLIIVRSDLKHFIIPDRVSLPLIPMGLIASTIIAPPNQRADILFEMSLAAVIGFCFFYMVKVTYKYLRQREGLGMGDVKLMAVAGAWTGLGGINLVILLAACSALLVVFIAYLGGRRFRTTTAIPFGVFLAPGIWVTWSLQLLGVVEKSLL